jgi:hypothetical protein
VRKKGGKQTSGEFFLARVPKSAIYLLWVSILEVVISNEEILPHIGSNLGNKSRILTRIRTNDYPEYGCGLPDCYKR